MRIKNKQGFEILPTTIVRVIIGVIVLFFMSYMASNTYAIFIDNSESKKASVQMDKVEEVIKKVQDDSKEGRVEIFPKPNWFFRTFVNYDFPASEEECRGKKSCLCLCENFDCKKTRSCRGFGFDVKVDETYRDIYEVNDPNVGLFISLSILTICPP